MGFMSVLKQSVGHIAYTTIAPTMSAIALPTTRLARPSGLNEDRLSLSAGAPRTETSRKENHMALR